MRGKDLSVEEISVVGCTREQQPFEWVHEIP